MSTTETQGIDAKTYLGGWLQGLTGMYLADIKAIPEDKWTATFGGCTRNAGDLTADAISMLMWMTEALKGNVIQGNDTDLMDAIKAECSTREGAAAKFRASCDGFAAALNEADNETLTKSIMAPWGMETPTFMLAQIAVSHVWYHDGQLNYIQCLLGDDKVHWMGG